MKVSKQLGGSGPFARAWHMIGQTGGALCLVGLLIAVTGAALFRISLADYSLWFDELASVFFAGQPFGNLWGGWMVRETNPPLYYTLLQSWIAIVGLSTIKLRLFSILAGLLAIVVAYIGVGQNYGRRAGIIAALMLALSAQQLNFSLLVRSYIFLYLAISISFYGLLGVIRSLDDPGRKSLAAWTTYVLGAVAAVHLHTTACIWPLAATISLIAADRRYVPFVGNRWLHLACADLLIVIASSWWLYITYLQLRVPNANISWIVWPGMRETASYFFSTVLLSRDSTGWAKIIPLAVASAALLGVARTWDRPATRLTLLCPITATLLFVMLSFKQPVIIDRTILWVSIFPLTLAAAGLNAIRQRRVFAIAVPSMLILLGINLAKSSHNLHIENWTGAVMTMAKNPRAVLLVDGESMGVVANSACAVDLGTRSCPFPVLALQRSDDGLDPWAKGYGGRPDIIQNGEIVLRADADIYLIRRNSHDVLATLHRMDMLKTISLDGPNFLGPYKSPFTDGLVARTSVKNGLVRVEP